MNIICRQRVKLHAVLEIGVSECQAGQIYFLYAEKRQAVITCLLKPGNGLIS